MAERADSDPDRTVEIVLGTVTRLRDAWSGGLSSEATKRFAALAEHYARRLDTLPVARGVF